MNELPKGWIETTLDDACAKISDGTHHSPKEQYNEPADGLYKYVTAKNIRMAGLDLGNLTYVPEKVHREIYNRCNPELGDVLLTKDGVNTGDVAINTLDEEFSLLSSVALLKPHRDLLDPKYLRYYIESPQGTKRLTGEMRGAAIRRIILRSIKAASVPIAPLPEQRRIVARIEELFSRLDAGVAALPSMSTDSSASIVSKVWNYAHVLKNAGVGYGDYVEQITYLLFLKLADEMTELGFDPPSFHYGGTGNPIPNAFAWSELSSKSGDDLEWSGATWTIRQDRPEGWRGGANQIHYRHTLENLGKEPGLVGITFRKAQNKISNPSDLQRVTLSCLTN